MAFFGLIPMVLILSITSILISTGLVLAINRIFPKEMGKREMTSIRESLRQKPLLGTFVVALVYFIFLYFPTFLALILILPLYSIFPLPVALFIEFLYNFGFMMLLWLLVVPKSLRLPIGKSKFNDYLKSIKLVGPEIKEKPKLIMNIVIGLLCAGLYFGSSFIFGSLLGDYVFDPSIVFGSPRIVSGGIIFGWFIFIIALIPGIWEEWAFRGVIIPLNSKKYSKLTVLMISSIIFGIFHLINILYGQDWVYTIFQVIFASAFGFLFGYLFIKTNSLLPSIILHYLFDSLGQLFVNTIFPNELSVVLFLIFGIGMVPAILGIVLVFIITKYAFPRLYQD
jgi:membrane protease YdiL (CAAX protease family)